MAKIYGISKAAQLLLVSSTLWGSSSRARGQFTECSSDIDCEGKHRRGSKCLESGECSNPFVAGCLHTIDPDAHSIRHCNSDDMDEDNCKISPFYYPEIRINNQDWETAIIFSWILQICLMEFLDVPVTVGLGSDTVTSSFYSVGSAIPYSSKSYAWDAIHKANELGGNCLATKEDCVHVIPDVWLGQRLKWEQDYRDGQIDYIDGNGQVGKISWYIPKYTASRHPFTVTHMGLALDRNRTASLFKRPTTWIDYCHEVSRSNCSLPDGRAEKYPEQDEMGSYFANGYMGHFRDTAKNNCTGPENSATCTGHIVNGPCTWSTFLEAQAYWNGIALVSDGPDLVNGGYAYSEMLQIWAAANATKSDVIMWWYDPDSLIEAFRDTDFEFTRVYLPSPSVECRESRTSPEDRCSADPVVRRGGVKGSCDNVGHTTKKAIASSLRDMAISSEEEDRSPGYYYIRNFNIDELEISDILFEFVHKGRTGQAAREAVCRWVANNTDYLKSFVPPSYPREFRYGDDYEEPVTMAANAFGFVAALYIVVSYIITCSKRKAPVFVYAQVQFIFMILFGLLLVSFGAIITSLEPNDANCVARVWLVSLGYTFELAPLIIKVSAMNRLMRASRRMRRVRIKPHALYAKVIFLTMLVAIYLIVWTAVDPSLSTEVRTLSENQSVITLRNNCSSHSRFWLMAINFWEGLLIVWAFVLAFQSRHVKAEFNESRSLGMMTYSHFVFAVLRIVTTFVFEDEPYTSAVTISFLLSLDVILALCIYILPKLIQLKASGTEDTQNQIHLSSSVHNITERATIGNTKSPLTRVSRLLFGDANITENSDRYSESESKEGSSHFLQTESSKLHFNAGESTEGSSRRNQLSESSVRRTSNSSVSFWTSTNSNESDDTTTTSTTEKKVNRKRRSVTFAGDNNTDKDLQQKLVQKDTEIEELKDVVRLLQEAQRLQEARIRDVASSSSGDLQASSPPEHDIAQE